MDSAHGITKENILSMFPHALAGDKSLSALGEIAAELLVMRRDETDLPRIFPCIDRLDEAVLDILAYDLKVDWYDYDYPIRAKRELIKGSILAHKRLGTVYAVETVLNSLYPGSEIEEWFDYGGEPGYFRINVDVTESAGEGAVTVYSAEEIAYKLRTVKRLSAHLENVSYMVKRGLVIGRKIDCWQVSPPECGTIRCGTYWTRKQLGWTEKRAIAAMGGVGAFAVSPELTGTLPVDKAAGWSVLSGLSTSGLADGFGVDSKEAGTVRTGTEWTRKQLGFSEDDGIASGCDAGAFAVSPELTGTLPETAAAGLALTAGVFSAGRLDGFAVAPGEAGEVLSGTEPETAELGHTVTGEVSAGSNTEEFLVSPELTGTLPETPETQE